MSYTVSLPSHRLRPGLRIAAAVCLLFVAAGCEPPTPPSEAAGEYDQLVQQALAETKARADSTLFWLRNTGNAQARTAMLALGVDYLRYDRAAGVVCVWSGEGLWPARGYVTAPEADTVPTDSVGVLCNIEGTCTAEVVSEQWARFECR
jgi:hypothetical protein